MNIFYTNEHEWLKIDGDQAVIGITEYAAKQLGDITYIELPQIGTSIKVTEVLCDIESVKAASDIYCPVSGQITEVNSKLQDSPEIINASPQEDGWIAKIHIQELPDKSLLMDHQQYTQYIDSLG
ncbi:glycine cleavage system protein GcvH [Elusimicrobiota bacterium]